MEHVIWLAIAFSCEISTTFSHPKTERVEVLLNAKERAGRLFYERYSKIIIKAIIHSHVLLYTFSIYVKLFRGKSSF